MEEGLETKKIFSPSIIIIGAVIVAILAWFFVISPTLKDNEAKQKVIEIKRSNLSILKDKLTKLKDLSSKEKKIQEDTEKALAALPDNKDYARILYQIEKIASRSSVYVKSITPPSSDSVVVTESGTTATQEISGVKELEYTLELRGSYEQLKSFLTDFYKGIRVSKIKKIEIKSNTSDANSLEITITFSTFYKDGDGSDSLSGDTNETK